MTIRSPRGWKEISSRDGFAGAETLAQTRIRPLLERELEFAKSGKPLTKRLQLPLVLASFLFVCLFALTRSILPDSFLGEVLAVLVFPFLFFGSFLAVAYFFQDRIFRILSAGQANFVARARALHLIAEHLGLTYIPAPGGAPSMLKAVAEWRHAPARLKQLVDTLDDHGGMEEPLEVARQSGVLSPNVQVIGSQEQKQKYQDHQIGAQSMEDGFQGTRKGLAFSALEWREAVDEAPDIHHLIIVLKAPFTLHALTQLKSRETYWPFTLDDSRLETVEVSPKAFSKQFRLRSNDQVEARTIFNPAVIERVIELAHEETVRAVAFADHLVIDIAGSNRFNLLDLASGHWSDETLAQTFSDLADLFALIDACEHAFMLKRML